MKMWLNEIFGMVDHIPSYAWRNFLIVVLIIAYFVREPKERT